MALTTLPTRGSGDLGAALTDERTPEANELSAVHVESLKTRVIQIATDVGIDTTPAAGSIKARLDDLEDALDRTGADDGDVLAATVGGTVGFVAPTALGLVPSEREVVGVDGLTGGGDLSANRSIGPDLTGADDGDVWTYSSVAGRPVWQPSGAGGATLQSAYEAGNTIQVSNGEGTVAIDGLLDDLASLAVSKANGTVEPAISVVTSGAACAPIHVQAPNGRGIVISDGTVPATAELRPRSLTVDGKFTVTGGELEVANLTATGDLAVNGSLIADAGGDLDGTYPNPTVTQARGLRETSGPTTLAMSGVAHGALLARSVNSIVGVPAINDTQHGDRGGGTLHAEASTVAAGFMSAADVDRLGAQTVHLDWVEDFHGATTGMRWDQAVSGAGAAIGNHPEAPATTGIFGVIQLLTGSTATGSARLGHTRPLLATGRASITIFEARVRLQALSTATEEYEAVFGWGDASHAALTVPDPTTYGVWFSYERGATGTNWRARTKALGVTTDEDTGVAVTTSWVNLRIDIDAAEGEARFYIDGVLTNTITSDIPDGALQLFPRLAIFKVASAGASSVILVDRTRARQSLLTPR